VETWRQFNCTRQRALLAVDRPTKILLGLIIVQIGLENLYLLFPVENYAQLHTAITAGILDNIIPAFLLFWVCLKYIKQPFMIIIALIWLSMEIIDGLARVYLQFAIYYADDPSYAYWFNRNYFLPLSVPYIALPLLWLGMIHKNFLSRPTALYSPLNTYLFFRKPKNVRDIFISLTGAPTSHVAVVHLGQHYFFKRGLDGYQKRPIKHKILKQGRLVQIKPPPDFGKMLGIKLGQPYRLISNNCVTILRGTGIEIGRLDFFPAVFMMRYL